MSTFLLAKAATLAALVITLYLLKWAFDLVTDPLRDIPGPFWTRFTRIWLAKHYIQGDFEKTNVELHRKYGPVVRIAPNKYSIDPYSYDPTAIKTIYGHGTGFTKSTWYSVWGHTNPAFKSLFNDLDPHSHSALRRKVANAYSMSSLISYEPYVDTCTTLLLQRLHEFSQSGEVFNMGHWFQCYAFEMIGKITFSTSMGFLDKGEDIHGIMEQLEVGGLYNSTVGLWPNWHQTLLGTLEKLSTEKKGSAFIDAYTTEIVDERRGEKENLLSGAAEYTIGQPTDFLTKFMKSQKENAVGTARYMTDRDIRVVIQGNIAAGSDTTSITLSSILYRLLRDPEKFQKLREEIDDASARGDVSDPITFTEAQKLPYLQAVVKEGLRIHPATGYTIPRVVPKGGAEIGGRHWPEGTVIGVNSWVAHRNRSVFGNDADHFRPERWLEEKPSSQMDTYFFAFGQGSRTCIGKNISLLEISKAIPQAVRHLDFDLVDSGKPEWHCVNHWFVKPKDFNVRVRKRMV